MARPDGRRRSETRAPEHPAALKSEQNLRSKRGPVVVVTSESSGPRRSEDSQADWSLKNLCPKDPHSQKPGFGSGPLSPRSSQQGSIPSDWRVRKDPSGGLGAEGPDP